MIHVRRLPSALLLALPLVSWPARSQNVAVRAEAPSSLEDQARRIAAGQKIRFDQPELVMGRVIRGINETDFTTLTDDPRRRVIMLMDGSGIEGFSGGTRDEILGKIGYPADYIRYLLEKGTTFRLTLFPRPCDAVLADWSGLGFVLERLYDSKISALFERHRSSLTTLRFADIEAQGEKMSDAYKRGSADPTFMTSERLSQDATLWQFRAFLYNELRLNELYSGDGYIRTESGERGNAEYFFVNRPISTIPGAVSVKLE